METASDVLAASEAQDAIMDEDFDVKSFMGTMERGARKLPAARRRVEQLREERHLRTALSEYWDE
jgi:hypothetical protein